MEVRLYKHGTLLDLGKPDPVEHKGGGKRGRLNGDFSAASFRRLRTFCITHSAKSECWGVTFTIPGLSVVRFEYVSSWIHRITQYCNYWKIPLIWRAEVQRRGQAHFHLVCYCDIAFCLRLCLMWQKHVSSSGKCLSHEKLDFTSSDVVWINRAFVRGSSHMFDVQRLRGDFSSWRYLVAHQSKSKQAQRGWIGRQWGVCYRSGFTEDSGTLLEVSDPVMFSVRRWVRRLVSGVKHPHYKKIRISSVGKHFLLVDPKTVEKMISWGLQLHPF